MVANASLQIDAERSLLSTLATDVVAVLGTRAAVAPHGKIAQILIAHYALRAAFVEHAPYDEEDEEGAPPLPAAWRPVRKSFMAAPIITRPALWPIPSYNLPAIDSIPALCELLEMHPQRLEAWSRRWRQRPGADDAQRHSAYFAYWQAKKRGGARLIEIPKPDLKQVQRRLLERVIARIDPHECATGFRRGYSLLHHAERHVGQPLVLKCDLRDFFVSVRASRIHAIFRHMGYDETIARSLTAIVTSRVSRQRANEGMQYGVDRNTAGRYQCDHLPQGAPTSPALANLAAFGLDLRLESLAASAGAKYSRYADDLTFSGARSSGLSNERFYLRVCAIALEEGFAVNVRKTRLMPASQRQHITGLVVNERANCSREEFDQLKAILTNAARTGLDAQNRARHRDFRSHLLGRTAFMEQINPARGAKLREIWKRIES